ncbi:unnamed protein product [Spirodela intermedia]|uniref:Reverse transcriptase/retrotransposon-derived protein RNase H-like domain-containing protein n=1 Tax=Spirodela intermedia TaxID=51605 RepID=A0A7I8ISL9_SPIIN|nr:unnamed protein product [Spirodela intermedia]CAA6660971.1 unnamed protein product [Spirodela intermedia]
MESLEVDLEALKEDSRSIKEILQQLTQELATLMTHLPHEPSLEQSQRQPKPHPLQNSEQREGNYKPNRRTEVPNFTSDNLDGRNKGFCFYCNDKFGPGHRCRRDLNILIVHGEEKSQEDFQEEDWAPLELCSQEEGTLFTAHVSLNSVMRLTQHGTMELWYCDWEWAYRARSWICHKILLKIQDLLIIQDFLPLNLSSINVILGIQWLKTLGWIHSHYGQLIMKFMLNNTIYTIFGDASLNKTRISFKAAKRELKRSHICAVELHQLSGTALDFSSTLEQSEIAVRLHKRFSQIFEALALNKSTVSNRFPIPIVNELLKELHEMSTFRKPLSRPMRITTNSRLCHLVRPYLRKFVLVFFDDILIYSKTHKEHDEHLDNVFLILATNNLYPTPKHLKALRGFLGLTGYYRRFKNYFHWDFDAQDALHKLKVAMTSTPVLALPNFSQKFVVEIDASIHRIGVEIHTKYHKWVTKLMGFNFQIQYKARRMQLQMHYLEHHNCVRQINKEVENDSRLSKIKIVLIEGSTFFPHYSIQQGPLLYKDLSMDFKEGLPKSKGYDSIHVIVDRLSKFGHFIPLRHLFIAKDIPKYLQRKSSNCTKLKMISSYHPQTDSYNTSHHSAIKMTPFKAVYGRDPPTLTCYGSPMSSIDVVDTYLKERDDTLQLLKENLLAAQSKMKAQLDKHRRDIDSMCKAPRIYVRRKKAQSLISQ